MVLICISLIMTDVEHLCMCLLASVCLPWRNVCLVLWPIFWLGHLFFWSWAGGVACIFLRLILWIIFLVTFGGKLMSEISTFRFLQWVLRLLLSGCVLQLGMYYESMCLFIWLLELSFAVYYLRIYTFHGAHHLGISVTLCW